MNSFKIKYEPLFFVNILHEYHIDIDWSSFILLQKDQKHQQLSNFDSSIIIKTEPSERTKRIIDGHQMVFKRTQYGFIIWASTKSESEPFMDLDKDLSFTFLLKVKDPQFFNYTNLKFETVKDVYFFSNQVASSNFPIIVDDNYILAETSLENEFANLTNLETQNLFGIIRISVLGATNLLNNSGIIQNPEFNIWFNKKP